MIPVRSKSKAGLELVAFVLIVGFVMATLFTLASSKWGTGVSSASTGSSSEWSNHPEPYTMTYLGHPLHCLVTEDTNRYGNIGGVTCDFTRYWRTR